MALSENTVIDRIEILGDGQMRIREATAFNRDGVEATRGEFSLRKIDPARDADKLDTEPKLIRDVAGVVWTQEVIDARKADLEARRAKVKAAHSSGR